MAWLQKEMKLNPDTGRKRTYFRICWRDPRGRKRTRAIGFLSAAEAKSLLAAFERKTAQVPPAEVPQTSERGSKPSPTQKIPTLAEYMVNVFLPVVARDKAPATYAGAQRAAKNLIPVLGKLYMDEVEYAVVDVYITKRKKAGRRSRTIILELRYLRQALQHAKACKVISTMPELPKLRDTDRKPHRFLTPEESERLLHALRPLEVQPHVVTRGKPPIRRDGLTYLAVLMALNLGMRKSEILTRGWEDIRWTLGPLGAVFICGKPEVGFKVKMGRDRTIPLTPDLRNALEREHELLGCPNSGWIFPSPRQPSKPRSDFKHALKRACRTAGLPPMHPHSLRHTWATRLAMAGVDRRTLMELGGWREGRMLDEIYAHSTDEHKSSIMSRMGIGEKSSE